MLKINIKGLIPAAKNSFEKCLTKLLKVYVDFLVVNLFEVTSVETLGDIQLSAMSRNEPLFA
jgi:hypothetical protein